MPERHEWTETVRGAVVAHAIESTGEGLVQHTARYSVPAHKAYNTEGGGQAMCREILRLAAENAKLAAENERLWQINSEKNSLLDAVSTRADRGVAAERARIRRELLDWEQRMTINRGSEDEMIVPDWFREALDRICPAGPEEG